MRSKRKNNALLPVILFGGSILFIIGGLIFAGIMRKNSIERPANYTSQDQIPRLSGSETKDALETGKAVLLDTRDASQFARSHIKNAINISVVDVEARLNELDKNTWYITYCT